MTSNKLKIIAVIAMIMDHFGYYFNYLLSDEIYLICRIIGRIAMPIFTYLIIEGYFHTSNFKNYIKRLSVLAVITQGIIIILDFLAGDISYKIGDTGNILFSFVILLGILKLFEKAIYNENIKNKLIFVLYILCVVIIYKFIDLDYGITILVLGIGMYITKKYITNIYAYKIINSILIIAISLLMGNIMQFALLSFIPIALYNGQRGKINNTIKYLFYYIFPIQHLLLYGTYILIK